MARAIRFNRATYSADSIRLIQDVVGVDPTGAFDPETIQLIARFQADFGLGPDGRVGPETFRLLTRELSAEGAVPGTCLTLFQRVGPDPLRFFRTSGTTGAIRSRFFINAEFDPRCNCEEFEYRQFIAGNVQLVELNDNIVNLNQAFVIPGGGLPLTPREDGDVSIPVGTAGNRYGHRRATPNPADRRDRYLPDRRTGCRYEAHDFPDLGPVPAALPNAGEIYEWDMRFRGVIIRRGHGVVEQKFWNIRDDIVIPPP